MVNSKGSPSSRAFAAVVSLKRSLSRTFSRKEKSSPSSELDQTPKPKRNEVVKVNQWGEAVKGDASSSSAVPPAAPAQESVPKQPEILTLPVGSNISASAGRHPNRSKSGKVSFHDDISVVFMQAENELDQLNETWGSVTPSLSFGSVTPGTTTSLGSVASFESGSLEMLERSMRAREAELRSILYRTQQRLRDRFDEGDCVADEADTEEMPATKSEVGKNFSPTPTLKSEIPTYSNLETIKERSSSQEDDSSTPTHNGNCKPGAGGRSSVQLWKGAGHYIQEALHFTGNLQGVQDYFARHSLHEYYEALLNAIVSEQPEDPWAFSSSFLKKHGENSTQLPSFDNHPPISEKKLMNYLEDHDLIKSMQKAFTAVGRVQPKEPVIWLQEFFLSRNGSKTGSLAPKWVQVRANDGSIYWIDLVSGGVETEKPKDFGVNEDIWEATDATAMQAVIRDLRRGNLKHEDASEWIRLKFVKKVRLMNCVLRPDGADRPGWAGALHKLDKEALQEVEKYIHSGYGVDQDLLQEVSDVDVTSIRMLKRVFASYAESTADKVDYATMSRDRFLEMLEDLELCKVDASPDQSSSPDSLLKEELLKNGLELTKKDAEDIFDMIFASVMASSELPCNNGNTGPQIVNNENPIMFFFGFLVSLQMISKKTRRPLNDVLADITFSHISAAHRPAFAAMSNKGIMARVKGVFRRFTGGKSSINQRQFRQLCEDCDIIHKEWGFTMSDADAVFSSAAARCGTSTKALEIKNAEVLIKLVATRVGVPKDDIVGLIAWSFGPKVDVVD